MMNKWKVCKSCGGVFAGNNNDRIICPQCNGKLELIQSNIPLMETCDITAISHDFNFIKSMMELYDTNIIEYKSRIKEFSNQPRCPKCGSTAISTGARGVNYLWGFIGASKTVNRCSNCGYTWKPKR